MFNKVILVLPAVAWFFFEADAIRTRSEEKWTSIGENVRFVYVDSWLMSVEAYLPHNYPTQIQALGKGSAGMSIYLFSCFVISLHSKSAISASGSYFGMRRARCFK